MVSFRAVQLPVGVRGQLWLASMPGRYDPLADSWREILRLHLSWIVCLALEEEIRAKSPDYAEALSSGTVPCAVQHCPIPDFGTGDDQALARCVVQVADWLRQGEYVLVHCGAGFGRTGMFAVVTLVALGMPLDEARREVTAAGSSPERPVQQQAIIRLVESLDRQKPSRS